MQSSSLSYDNTASLGAAPACVSCWGAQLHGGATCMPRFVPGKHNFKNKFCDNCKDSIMVPVDRICAVTAEQAACFINKRSEGFWNRAPESMGSGQYRIINNTAGSLGPWLVLFREQPPPFDWSATSRSNPCQTMLRTHTHLTLARPAFPETWITEDGCVRLCVAKGTLVPAKTLRCGHPQVTKPCCAQLTLLLYPYLLPTTYHPHFHLHSHLNLPHTPHTHTLPHTNLPHRNTSPRFPSPFPSDPLPPPPPSP